MYSIIPISINFNEFEPFLTEKQIKIHYNGHYIKYINNFNKLLETDTKLKKLYSLLYNKNLKNNIFRKTLLLSIVEIYESSSYIVHNVAQIFNHELYWKTLINHMLYNDYLIKYKYLLFSNNDNFNIFYDKFISSGMEHFGSGWLWIIFNNNKLDIITSHDAIIPIFHKILGVIDIWEHSYYVDYTSEKKLYLEKIFLLIDWKRIYNKINSHPN